jgi:hypothetical protein
VSGQIPRPMGSIVLVTALLLWGVGMGETTDTARADDCVAAPNSAAPGGSHWYYRVDRASQRKCWYLRATDQPAQHTAAKRTSDTASPTTPTAREKPAIDSASAPTSMNPGGSTEVPVPRVKPQGTLVSTATTVEPPQKSAKQRIPAQSTELATASASAPMPTAPDDTTPSLRGVMVPSAQMSGATTDQSVRLSAQNGSAASSITNAPAAQPSLSPQINNQGVVTAPAANPAWPNPRTSLDKTQEPAAPPSEAQAVQPAMEAKAPNDADGTAQATTSATNTGVTASLTSAQIAIFAVAALGLVVAGFLLRIVVKIFVGRRHRIAVDHHDFDLVNDRHAHALPDDQIVDQRDGLTDYLQRSNKAAASKSGSRRPSQVADKRMNDAPDTLPLQMDKIDKRERRLVGVDPHESEWIDTKRRQSKRGNDEQRHKPIGIDPREDTPIDDQHQQRRRHDQLQRGAVAVADELIDDLQSSLVATRRDYRPGPSFQESLNEGGGRDAAPVDEIREREEGLEQLRRSLDRLLQSPNVA